MDQQTISAQPEEVFSSRHNDSAPRCPAKKLRDAQADVAGVQVHGLSIPELKELSGLAGRLKTSADSLLVRIAAEVKASGTMASPQKVLQQTTTMSKRDANRVGKVAEGLQELPNVAERLDSGKLTLEHAASLVDTARHTGAAAVDNNTDLLDRAGKAPADLFAHEARRFADQHAADRGEERLKTQRRRRKASLFMDEDTGMGRFSGWFDPISFGVLRQAIDNHADLLRRHDYTRHLDCTRHANGTDSPGSSNGAGIFSNGTGIFAGFDRGGRRTAAQLRADALFELATQRDALTHEPYDPGNPDHGAKGDPENPDTPGGENTASRGENTAKRGAAKPSTQLVIPSTQLVIVADIGLLDKTDRYGRCEIPGTGPVPPSILKKLSPDTKLAGIIFGGNGRVLWLGHNKRLANPAQHLALTARDQGCVQCGAPMHQCDIHHVQPWERGGPTDVNNLQPLCSEHHRHHHGPHKQTATNKAAQNAGSQAKQPDSQPNGQPRQAGTGSNSSSRTRDGP